MERAFLASWFAVFVVVQIHTLFENFKARRRRKQIAKRLQSL